MEIEPVFWSRTSKKRWFPDGKLHDDVDTRNGMNAVLQKEIYMSWAMSNVIGSVTCCFVLRHTQPVKNFSCTIFDHCEVLYSQLHSAKRSYGTGKYVFV